MTHRAPPPLTANATPLRPATYAGIAAAVVSIGAAVVIRLWPAAESPMTGVHLVLTFVLFVMGGALAAKLGGDGWRAGLFAGLLDALIGHVIAFLVSRPPDPSRLTLPKGVEATTEVLGAAHLWGAVLGAVVSVVFAIAGGALGGWYARRSGVARAAARRR